MLLPHDYATFLDQAVPAQSDPLEAERRAWKTDHCQIGHSLAATWNFPSVLTDVIAHHHDAVTHQSPRVRWLAQAACVAATMSGFHTMNREEPWSPARIENMLPPGSSLQYEDLLETIVCKVNETECGLL